MEEKRERRKNKELKKAEQKIIYSVELLLFQLRKLQMINPTLMEMAFWEVNKAHSQAL